MLLHRYGNIEYVLRLPVRSAIQLIKKAMEEEERAVLFQMWLMRFTLMDKDSYVSFEEFYENARPKDIDKRPKEEIMKELLGG